MLDTSSLYDKFDVEIVYSEDENTWYATFSDGASISADNADDFADMLNDIIRGRVKRVAIDKLIPPAVA